MHAFKLIFYQQFKGLTFQCLFTGIDLHFHDKFEVNLATTVPYEMGNNFNKPFNLTQGTSLSSGNQGVQGAFQFPKNTMVVYQYLGKFGYLA